MFCERSANDHTSLVVSDAHCDHSLRPADIRLCEVAVCQWGVSQWTEVSLSPYVVCYTPSNKENSPRNECNDMNE